MQVGVFGGTFDPPHIGHLIVAQDAALVLGLDRVLFVPAAAPPHKRDRTITAGAIRLAMLHAALAGNARFALDSLELERGGPASYSVDTLRELNAAEPSAELWLLMGRDQWREFPTWREPDEIMRLARIGVIERGATRGPSPAPPPARVNVPPGMPEDRVRAVPAMRIDVSSSEIRRRVGVGESIRYLVPDPVVEIIFREQLYRQGHGDPR